MVDSVLAPQTQTASSVGKAGRVNARAPVGGVRPASPVGQASFSASLVGSALNLQPASNDQGKVGNGLLSTSMQIILAETRTQEATAAFVAPEKFGQAINVYIETQGHVRDTIRANVANAGAPVSSETSPSDNGEALAGAGALIEKSPSEPVIDSSVD